MGQKYAAWDATSANPLSLYDDDESPVPADVEAIAITDEEWVKAYTTAGYSIVNQVLTPPAPMTDAQISEIQAAATLAGNTATQKDLLSAAVQAMTPLLLALQLNNATAAQKASAISWQSYYTEVQAVDLTQSSPAWPTTPAP